MKQTKLLSLLLALCILLSSFVACAKPTTPTPEKETNQETEKETNPGSETETNPGNEGETDPNPKDQTPATTVTYEPSVRNSNPHTNEQQTYLNSKEYTKPLVTMNGASELSYPQAIVLKWNRKVEGEYKKPVECAVISEDESFSNPIRIPSTTSQVELTNLELGKTFYWYVEGKIGDSIFKSEPLSVTVNAAAPRNLYVNGVTNCRDLGAWKTTDKVVLKQGLIFRTGRLSKIKDDGKKVLLDDLGIKTEIDLRTETQVKSHGDTTTASKLGSKVNYVFAPMEWEHLGSDNILTAPVNEESLLKVFEIFGDENNYPILFHCSIGTDRTGLVAFLILGLCGVSEKDLYRDFLFSGFGTIDKTPEVGRLNGFLETVKAASGATLAEKIENYLIGRGVTAEQIATIKKMMR